MGVTQEPPNRTILGKKNFRLRQGVRASEPLPQEIHGDKSTMVHNTVSRGKGSSRFPIQGATWPVSRLAWEKMISAF